MLQIALAAGRELVDAAVTFEELDTENWSVFPSLVSAHFEIHRNLLFLSKRLTLPVR